MLDDDSIVLRPTTAHVDLRALRANVRAIRAHVGGAKLMGIVKANAYGHGLIRTAKEILAAGVDQLGVAFLEEGIALRRGGVGAPILVLGGIIGNQIQHFLEFDLMMTASSPYKLQQIEELRGTWIVPLGALVPAREHHPRRDHPRSMGSVRRAVQLQSSMR